MSQIRIKITKSVVLRNYPLKQKTEDFALALPVLPFLVPGHLNGFKFALIRLLRIAVEGVPRDEAIFLPTALITLAS